MSSRLLDSLMPDYDHRATHPAQVAASAAETYRAAKNLQLAGVPVFWALLRLRLLLERWQTGPRQLPRSTSSIFQGFLKLGFIELGETPDQEYLIGGIGRSLPLPRSVAGKRTLRSPLARSREASQNAPTTAPSACAKAQVVSCDLSR